jgi:hypothetical protein
MKDEPGHFQTRAKHVFWSGHPTGDMLQGILEQRVAAGALESRDEPDKQYRWNGAFRESWETAG